MKPGMLASLAALILMAAGSCERTSTAPLQEVRFQALPMETRTSFTTPQNDLYPVIWTDEDRSVRISLDSATPVEAPVQASEDGRTARFSASFTDDGRDAHTFYALSPASAYTGINAGEWAYSVPEVQTPTAESVDPSAMVLCASVETRGGFPDEVRFSFTHLTAYGCFSLLNINTDIQSVSLDFGEGNALTVQTASAGPVWFGLKPTDVSGKTVRIRVKTDAGAYTKDIVFPEGKAFEAGKVARFTVDMTGASYEPDSKSISILAIGNSFSIDAMEYLYGYLKQAGYESIYLGNLYIGGCTLLTHAHNLTNGTAAYTYYTNSSGTWSHVDGRDALSAIKSRHWDYVSMQQASGYSGMPDSYEPYLSTVVDTVKAYCPEAKRMWHMTWAYQKDSNLSDFAKYANNQTQMYEAILDAVRTKVLPRGDFDFVIPCGTAIQNLRTSFIRDHLTRDGYHMSYQVGRVATALMWLKQISGCPLDRISIRPSTQTLSETQIAAIKDAVEKAYAQPFSVTPSALTSGNAMPDTEILAQFEAAGYDISQYKPLPLDLVSYAYYNSTSNSTLVSRMAGSTASNLNQFASTTGVFSKEDIPVGSVIVLKPGFQYRPEGWTSLITKNASSARPANVTSAIVPVTSSWWGNWKYRAFNLAEYSNPGLTEERMQKVMHSFAIFVPVN